MTDQRRGLLFGITAYGAWGLFPLYFGLLKPAGPLEILAHRIIWSLVTVGVLILVLRRWRWFRTAGRRTLSLLAAGAVLIAVNWFVYIYGVNSSHVVETALGYFINPLISVLLGVVVLHERLRRTQWIALAIGAAAVVVLTVDYGRPPWIAITLAVSFGLYGLVKKVAGAPAVEGLTTESLVLILPALGYVLWLTSTGDAQFGHVSAGHTALMVVSGALTAGPLLAFAAAANRVPLATIGLLQYLTPTLQFLLGVTVLGEHMPTARWAGFALVWVALIVFSLDSLLAVRRASAAKANGPDRVSPPLDTTETDEAAVGAAAAEAGVTPPRLRRRGGRVRARSGPQPAGRRRG
ncbi:EamA family transporter RarD [Cryptosporangium aurantiacum]|uniref:Chloramphenicol-sensitive protein RarD n=1 Tax=Cryptosporangium aurantiacum TaxID=134849 RepID=A0A1M7RGL5_9ACTN|nr:EamA family transporter RarD [Cryptosporangium aurantiacum]SHN45356.1 chloramphenicol-sensitive protein RarD [Cryptosporangium aurantiacum]